MPERDFIFISIKQNQNLAIIAILASFFLIHAFKNLGKFKKIALEEALTDSYLNINLLLYNVFASSPLLCNGNESDLFKLNGVKARRCQPKNFFRTYL